MVAFKEKKAYYSYLKFTRFVAYARQIIVNLLPIIVKCVTD